jgi:hypothetical protein
MRNLISDESILKALKPQSHVNNPTYALGENTLRVHYKEKSVVF